MCGLMSSRRKMDYVGVLRHVLTLLGQLCVQIVTYDFEAALLQSVRGVMPHVRLVGYLFHCTHALYRVIQGFGLQQSYQTDVGTQSLMHFYIVSSATCTTIQFHQLHRGAMDLGYHLYCYGLTHIWN